VSQLIERWDTFVAARSTHDPVTGRIPTTDAGVRVSSQQAGGPRPQPGRRRSLRHDREWAVREVDIIKTHCPETRSPLTARPASRIDGCA
jgi:hypothetical protein